MVDATKKTGWLVSTWYESKELCRGEKGCDVFLCFKKKKKELYVEIKGRAGMEINMLI